MPRSRLRPNPALRPVFLALDQDFDRWQEYYLSRGSGRGEAPGAAAVKAVAAIRRYSDRLARDASLDPDFLWHAYLSWQAHWIAFAEGVTGVEPNRAKTFRAKTFRAKTLRRRA